LAIALKGTSCDFDENSRLEPNKILSGGCASWDKDTGGICGISEVARGKSESDALHAVQNEWKGRCTRMTVDYTFEFIACVFGIGVLVVAFFASRRSGRAVY